MTDTPTWAPRPPWRGALFGLSVLAVSLGACTSRESRSHPHDLGRLVGARPPRPAPKFSRLPPGELRAAANVVYEPYRIGRGDVLNIQGDRFKGFGETTKGDIAGTKVKPDGLLYLPDLAPIQASGKTVLEVQEAIREALKKFNEQPFVSVDVLQYRSQKFFILGEVGKPGVATVDGETSLLEALASAGGFTKHADVEQAFVVRQQSVLAVSLADIVRRGDMSQNMVLRDRDLIFVPSLQVQRVFVFGEVGGGAGVFPISDEGMTLVEAVALAGGLKAETADVNQVRVFRGGWCNPEVFTISACELYTYGYDIQLFPGDRVFVAPMREASYARALALVSPLLTTPLSLATTYLAIDAVSK